MILPPEIPTRVPLILAAAVNLASDLVYAVALPFAAIATTYLYFDLNARSAAASSGAASST